MGDFVALLKAYLPPGHLTHQCNDADEAYDTVDEECATLEHLLYFLAIYVPLAWIIGISKQFLCLLELLSYFLELHTTKL